MQPGQCVLSVCMYACTCAVRGMRSNHLLSLPQVTHPYTHRHGIQIRKKHLKSRTDWCGVFQPQNPITKHEQTLVSFENNASLWGQNQSSFGKNPRLLFGKCCERLPDTWITVMGMTLFIAWGTGWSCKGVPSDQDRSMLCHDEWAEGTPSINSPTPLFLSMQTLLYNPLYAYIL